MEMYYTDGHLGCFQLWAVVNDGVVNMGIEVSVEVLPCFHFFWIYTQK